MYTTDRATFLILDDDFALGTWCLTWRIVDCQESSAMKVVKYQELGDMLSVVKDKRR